MNSKITLYGSGFLALEWNDVMRPDYDVTLWRWICVQKWSHQEDYLISRIFHSRANNSYKFNFLERARNACYISDKWPQFFRMLENIF